MNESAAAWFLQRTMAAELLMVAERRWLAKRRFQPEDRSGPTAELCQFTRVNSRLYPRMRVVPAAERPPVRSLSPGLAR